QHKNRTVLECHPHGPGTDPLDDHKQFLSELQQRDIFLPQYLTKLINEETDGSLTLGDLIQNYQSPKNDEESVDSAIALSLLEY
ncbi:unnamed protein product, partial [Didymodactylos carnosus]